MVKVMIPVDEDVLPLLREVIGKALQERRAAVQPEDRAVPYQETIDRLAQLQADAHSTIEPSRPRTRVLRVLEYTYDTPERMANDIARWQIGATATRDMRNGMTIKSATFLPETET